MAQFQQSEEDNMVTSRRVCDSCAAVERENGVIFDCDLEDKDPCTPCFKYGLICPGQAPQQPSPSSSRPISSDSNLQSQHYQTPLYRTPATSLAPTPAVLGTFDETNSLPFSRTEHPGMPTTGSNQIDSGLEGLPQADSKTITTTQNQQSTINPALLIKSHSVSSNSGSVAHDNTYDSPVPTFTFPEEHLHDSIPVHCRDTTTLAAQQLNQVEDIPMASRDLPSPDATISQIIDGPGDFFPIAESGPTSPSSEMPDSRFNLKLRTRMMLNLFISNWDRQGGDLWDCPMYIKTTKSCRPPHLSETQEEIVNHCIEKHSSYILLQSQKALMCMRGMSVEEVDDLCRDRQEFEQIYGPFKPLWRRLTNKRLCSRSPVEVAPTWNEGVEAVAKEILNDAETERARHTETSPQTLQQMEQANGLLSFEPHNYTTATMASRSSQVKPVFQGVQGPSNSQSLAEPSGNSTATNGWLSEQAGQATQAVQAPPNDQSFAPSYNNTDAAGQDLLPMSDEEFTQIVKDVGISFE